MEAKLNRAAELLSLLRSNGWTNRDFWEAHILLASTPDRLMDGHLTNLLFTWGDIEGDRIACGEHFPCPPELEAELTAKWPVIR